MVKLHTYITTGILSLLLIGCANTDHKAYFEAHDQAFMEKTRFKEHFVQRGEFSLYAREHGTRSDQPTLIMMHGFPDSMHLYDWLIPEFNNSRHIITFDFLGWGNSDKPSNHDYDFASLKQDLDTIVRYFKLKQVVLVMHDASGPPAIDWAIENPDRTAGLVLLNTFYSPMPTLKRPEAIELFSTPGTYREISKWVTSNFDSFWLYRYNLQMSKFISSKTRLKEFQRVLGHQSLHIRPAFYALNHVLVDEVQNRKTREPLLKELTTPVCIIFGNDDPYLNSGVAETFHQLFINSELNLIKNAGHFVQVDKPHEVAKLLVAFPHDIKNGKGDGGNIY